MPKTGSPTTDYYQAAGER